MINFIYKTGAIVHPEIDPKDDNFRRHPSKEPLVPKISKDISPKDLKKAKLRFNQLEEGLPYERIEMMLSLRDFKLIRAEMDSMVLEVKDVSRELKGDIKEKV